MQIAENESKMNQRHRYSIPSTLNPLTRSLFVVMRKRRLATTHPSHNCHTHECILHNYHQDVQGP